MKKAIIHSYNIDVNLQCPNCRLFHRMYNNEIPKEKDKILVCGYCREKIKIPSLSITVKEKSKLVNFSSDQFDDQFKENKQKALRVLVAQGYPRSAVKNIIHEFSFEHKDVESIIKQTIVELANLK